MTKLKENIIAVVADNNNVRVKELNRDRLPRRKKKSWSGPRPGRTATTWRKKSSGSGKKDTGFSLRMQDATKESVRRKIDEMEAMLKEMGWEEFVPTAEDPEVVFICESLAWTLITFLTCLIKMWLGSEASGKLAILVLMGYTEIRIFYV